jgi:hypothetical protein
MLFLSSEDLAESRLQLHYAIQLIAATGAALATPKPDYSHASSCWNPDLNLFVGELINATTSFRVAIDPVNLTALILDQQFATVDTFSLSDKTLADALSWIRHRISQLGADGQNITLLSYPADDFPDHAIAHGDTFSADRLDARRAFIRYYAITYPLLQTMVDTYDGASPIYVWPHHFDMATLIAVPNMQPNESKTIGVGLSPGDQSYDEPYWYVSPYPYPTLSSLPALDSGFWHTKHWVGAVLTASQVESEQHLEAFLTSAVEKSWTLLGA